MSRIRAEHVAVLATPSWGDARRGAFATWIYISLGLPLCFAAGALVNSALASVQYSSSLSTNFAMIAYVTFITLTCVAVISGAVIAAVGVVAGMLLGRALARVAHWQVHLLAYFLLGTVAYGLVLLVAWFIDPNTNTLLLWLGPVTPVLVGVCVAGGWATAWRRAAKHDAPPAIR